MSSDEAPFAMLLGWGRAYTPHATADVVDVAAAIGAAVVRIRIRGALARLEEGRRRRSLGLVAGGEGVVANGAGTFVGAGDAVGEEGVVAARHDGAAAGARDGDRVAIDCGRMLAGILWSWRERMVDLP